MDQSFFPILALWTSLSMWLVLPLIPAILIYKLFPGTKVGLAGPLGDLTLKASGAFAAYFVTFLATYPLISGIRADIKGLMEPVWTVRAKVVMIDAKGNEVTDPALIRNLSVSIEPKLYVIQNDVLKLRVPGSRLQLPVVTVQIPGFGGDSTDLANPDKEIEVDESERNIEFMQPIVIRQFTGGGSGVGGDNE